MHPLTSANVEAELSYAYLHAVASHAGMSCSSSNRHEDNAGVDATLVAWGPFPGAPYRKEVDLKVQLKATIQAPTEVGDSYAFNLAGVARYNDLRSEAIATPRVLVVLFLPPTAEQWISHTAEALSLHRCAYWVSLRGAAESANRTAQTVYLPKRQIFDTAGLKALMGTIACNNVPLYGGAPL